MLSLGYKVSQCFLASVVLTLVVVEGAVDTSVCDPSTYAPYQGPPLPYFPDQVTWRVEVNVVGGGKDYTTDYHQFIDFTNNKHALHYWKDGQMFWTIFKYLSNEQISLTFPKPGSSATEATQCQISPLDQGFLSKLLGEITLNGKPHTPRPLDVLRLSKSSPLKSMGKMTLTNGVKVIGWESCQYNPNSTYTEKITWYFSDPELWYETIGKASVPVLLSLVGSTVDRTTGSLRNFNHQYSFADYRPYLTQGTVNSFQIPPGVYCKNDVNLKSLPSIPSHFTLRSEIIDGFTNTIGWTHEFYDSGLQLSRYDFKDLDGSKYGTNELKRIHDFNSGIAYVIDKVTGQCWIRNITLQDYDNRDIDSTHVRLRTPAEFFDLDRGNYSYVGQRISRGITCDVWVAKSYYWPPPGPNYFPTIWEYYFTADTRTAVGSTSEFNTPVQLRITQTTPPISKTFIFYEFDSSPSNFHDYDVSPCFDATGRADFLMVISDKYKTLIFNNLVNFKQLLRISLKEAAVISSVRVTNIGVDYNSTGVLLTFTLLDLTGVKGSVVSPTNEPSLDGAILNLVQAIDVKQFKVYVQDPNNADNLFELVPLSYTYNHAGATPKSRRKRATRPHIVKITLGSKSTGVSSGTLAGLAIGLLLGGFGIGFVVVLVILRMRRGNKDSPQSFVNPMKEME